MSFEVYGASDSQGKSNVDWAGLNQYVVDTCGLQTKKALIGVVSAIVDLGLQPLPDGEYDLDPDDVNLTEDELKQKYAEDFIKHSNGEAYGFTFGTVYDGQKKDWLLKKLVKQPPRQCVAFAVDFPSKQLDKGKFFGDTSGETKPLRLWMGGNWYRTEMVDGVEKRIDIIQNLTPIKRTNDDKLGWTVNPKSLIYKMAVATGVIDETQPFDASNLGDILGKSAQFEVSVGFNADKKDASKKHYFERIKLMGQLMEGIPVPTIDKTTLIQFNSENNLKDLNEVRAHVKNTIRGALNYTGSVIEGQLEAIKNGALRNDSSKESGSETAPNSNTDKVTTAQADDDF